MAGCGCLCSSHINFHDRSIGTSRKPKLEITDPQRRTLKEIRRIIDGRGFPPSIKEIAESLGISHASAHEQVSQLVRKGYLKREPRMARGLAITEKALNIDRAVKQVGDD